MKKVLCLITFLLMLQYSFGQKIRATVASGAHLVLATNWAVFANGIISVEHVDGTNKRIYRGYPFAFNPNAINIPGIDSDYAQNTAVLVYVVKPLIEVIKAPKLTTSVNAVDHLIASTDWTKFSTQKILIEEADGRNQHIYPAAARTFNSNAMRVIGLDQNFAQGTIVNVYDLDHAILFSEGNLSLGTSNFDNQFSVNGKIRSREIKVENANWPDYVFTKDYQLPTLRETESYIKEKGHLPGIPSAVDVKSHGVDLGEINARLLQKIEELTLHLIEMKKENDLQRKTIEDQNLLFQIAIDDIKSKIREK